MEYGDDVGIYERFNTNGGLSMDKKEESVIIELDTILEYRNGQVYIKKMNTNEMPATLTFNLIEALNNTIVEYYKGK